MTDKQDDFRSFAVGAGPRLLRLARLLTGNWTDAQDLVQSTLLRCFTAWARIRAAENPEAYACRVLIRLHVAGMRRVGHRREQLVATPPERPAPYTPFEQVEARTALEVALRSLPPRQRAVIVLRYYCDLSVTDIATTLGCSTGTVKSQAAKAMRTLRAGWPAGIL